jgi:hypothetical protein
MRYLRATRWMAVVLCIAAAAWASGAWPVRTADASHHTTGPSTTIASPANGATVSGSVPINVSASDPNGVSKVRFWAGAAYLGYDTTSPYAKTWSTVPLANGRYTLKVQAFDSFNNSTIRSISVTVVNPDTAPPTVAITSPGNGANVSGNVTINASASDNKGLQKVRFWAGASYLGFDASAPYAVNWNAGAVANGSYVLKAQAVDWANNTANATVMVNVVSCGTGCAPPAIGGCQVFPSDNPWNQDISQLPVHANSANYIASFNAGANDYLHADFGGDGAYGIPYLVVPQNEPMIPVDFVAYGDESDPGPYPIPLNAPIEGGSDRHTLAVQQGTCKLYEMFVANPQAGHWEADSGAIWDLNTGALRPAGWTSADAAGLPILPGLARYDEAQSGAITHALRVTVGQTQRGYILPATHWASSSTNPNLPPMGLRLRLKANYDISGYTGHARVILEALKKYGLIVADNGTSWYITGAMDPRWDDDDLNQLKSVPGTAFEAVNTGPIVTP